MMIPILINMYILLFINIIMGTMITVSSSSLLMAWLGMELNLLNFIPFMKTKNNPYSSESMMKYFLIQTISSSLFILFSLQFSFMSYIFHYMSLSITATLILKMALAPMHFWLLPMVNSLSWYPLLMIMTWQKVAPLSVMILMPHNYMYLILLNLLLGSIMMINQNSIKKLLVYSSISHLGWVMSTMMMNNHILIMYFFTYSINSILLILLVSSFKINYINQMLMFPKKMKMMFILMMFSMSGFPPFLMFFPKVMILFLMIPFSFFFPLFMILSSLISMFSYLHISWSLFFTHSYFSKFQNFLTLNSKMSMTMMITCFLYLMLLYFFI